MQSRAPPFYTVTFGLVMSNIGGHLTQRGLFSPIEAGRNLKEGGLNPQSNVNGITLSLLCTKAGIIDRAEEGERQSRREVSDHLLNSINKFQIAAFMSPGGWLNY